MKCDNVLKFFEAINQIPRGSGNEKGVSDYIVSFAKERNLWVHQDSANNVIIKKGATKGYENAPTVVIQGHMDMVCVKNPDVVHDFLKDPIKMIYEGDYLRADGTTLGADDGIAVAMGMALLDSDDIPHPALEVVFTTDEEVGMLGASSLDMTLLEGRILLNVDSEEEGIFTVGCAGGRKTNSVVPVEYVEPKNQEFANITISGLKGGHSGIDIVRYRANANKLMARTLESLVENCNIEVAEISGGSKDNAIPSLSEAIVSCSSIENLDVQCKLLQAEFLNEYYNIDDNITITVEKTEKTEVFSDESTTRVLTVMNNIPDGIQFMNLELDMPHTSNNLGVVSTDENGVSMVCAIRSDIPSKKIELYSKIESLTKLANGNTTFRGDYPAWEMKQDSPLRNLCEKVYTKQYGKAPVVETVHAGLECGLFAEKVPDFDMVSFGPNLLDIHSPSERAEIPSVERTWEFLLNVLAEIRE